MSLASLSTILESTLASVEYIQILGGGLDNFVFLFTEREGKEKCMRLSTDRLVRNGNGDTFFSNGGPKDFALTYQSLSVQPCRERGANREFSFSGVALCRCDHAIYDKPTNGTDAKTGGKNVIARFPQGLE